MRMSVTVQRKRNVQSVKGITIRYIHLQGSFLNIRNNTMYIVSNLPAYVFKILLR